MKITSRQSGTNGKVEKFCELCNQPEWEGMVNGRWRTRSLIAQPNGTMKCKSCLKREAAKAAEAQAHEDRMNELNSRLQAHITRAQETQKRMAAGL